MGKGPLRVRTHPFMMCQQAGALFYAGMEVSGLHNVPDVRESDFQYPYDEKTLIWSGRLAGYSLLRQRGHKMDAIEIRKYMAELVGTFVLVLAGVGTAVLTGDLVATAFAFGLSVVVMSVTVGQISGCHLNPAVSLGMALDKRITWTEFVFYFIFQVIGAIIGAFVVALFAMGMNDCALDELTSVGSNHLVHDDVAYSILIEVVLTFVFVLVALAATAKNGMDKYAGLFIGLTLTMVHFIGINLTGTSVNPARSIGPAIVDAIADVGNAGDVWVFIIAPLIGAAIAWAVWKYVLCDPKQEA